MSETKLKPCPFCGCEAKIVHYSPYRYYVQCVVCGAGTLSMLNEETAINAWNRRADNA